METQLKVTDEPAEVSFSDLVSGDNVINIPLFQRAYRWKPSHFDTLWTDIQSIFEDAASAQFLGVLVTVAQARQIGRPAIYDIVDGQQRLTTAYLGVLAIAQCAVDNGEADWGVEVAQTYLLLRPFPSNAWNTKLVPSSGDRQQFSDIWEKLRTKAEAEKPNAWAILGAPAPPPPFGQKTGALLTQYKHIERLIQKLHSAHGKPGLDKALNIFVSRLSFVTISLRDPIVAPTIFERLNARGERITTGDLVRNEIFSRTASDPALAQTIFSNYWEPFSGEFKNSKIDLEKMLFPYGLTVDSNTTKAELFNTLRKKWAALQDPVQIISDMRRYSPYFLAVASGKAIEGKLELTKSLQRLFRMNAPASIHSFVIQLGLAVGDGAVTEEAASDVLLAVESFLFRRAICGLEPTGLHAVFKGMWAEIAAKNIPLNGTSIVSLISARPTVPWPDDASFQQSIVATNLYARSVRDFAIREYEVSCHGESPEDAFTVEHILPQSLNSDWNDFSVEEHRKLLHSWANLIPLTEIMNPSVGHSKFENKRSKYEGSVFASAREVAKEFSSWTPADIAKRAEKICSWAIKRWPYRP